MEARERALLSINTLDIVSAIGCRDLRFMRRWLELAVRRPALAFARQVLAFDDAAAAAGIQAAARDLLSVYTNSFDVRGETRLPTAGPLLIVSNHPGMIDTAALFASIPRMDLRILAADRPFLRSLSAVSRSLIFISDDTRWRMSAMRAAVDHLRAGGVLLTFPAGEIEPDPAVLPGAREALDRWSASTATFLRFVPRAVVAPVVVSGVLSPRAQRHPLTRLRRSSRDREWLGAMLQIVARTISTESWPVRARVDFLEPFAAGVLGEAPEDATRRVRDRVADYLMSRERA